MPHPSAWQCAMHRCVAVVWAMSLLAGCAGAPPRQGVAPARDTPREAAALAVVYVVRRGWHVDIGLPVAGLDGDLASIASQWPGASYLLFGFGDRRYLMSRDTGSCSGLAALWPGPGLILVTAVRGDLARAFGGSEVLALPVDGGQQGRTQAYIRGSILTRQGTQGVEAVAVGPYDGSFYYAANAIYSGTHTCNTWAAEVLQAAGLPIESAGVVLAGQVWRRARRCALSTPLSTAGDTLPCPNAAR